MATKAVESRKHPPPLTPSMQHLPAGSRPEILQQILPPSVGPWFPRGLLGTGPESALWDEPTSAGRGDGKEGSCPGIDAAESKMNQQYLSNANDVNTATESR
ncbi:hypothetical protein G7046_g9436 [Stylonectria norvegica]|nr:hypothetical protein G7046_g9436 [Stylonectria norvegica]